MRLTVLAVSLFSVLCSAQVPWVVETPPVPSTRAGGMAIALSTNGSATVVGTDTSVGGTFVYGLNGGLQTPLATGPARGASAGTLLIDGRTTHLTAVAAANAGYVDLFDNVSFGFYGSVPVSLVDIAQVVPLPGGEGVLVTSDQGTVLKTWTLSFDGGVVSSTRGPDLSVGAAVRGTAVDERTGTLYLSLLNQGFARVDVATGVVEPLGFDGGVAEGIAFYPLPDGGGLLLAAEPARDDVAVYQLVPGPALEQVTTFTVTLGGSTVRGGRFVALTQAALPGYPSGLLVLQDDLNVIGGNYKLVSWGELAAATSPQLPVVIGSGPGGSGGTGGTGGTGGNGGSGGSGGSGSTGTLPHGNLNTNDPPPSSCSCGSPGPLWAVAVLGLWLNRRRARG